ncbi:MAG: hypothetical protein ISQ34_03315 [Rickettsiales bacterium]|nr:hypothetical protein [Rickettsiales bacterium]
MIKKFFLFLAILLSFSTLSIANETNLSISWNSQEGLRRLNRSNFKNDFYQLVNFYQPQINPLYCSAATAAMIINASNYGQISSQKTGEINKPKKLGGGKIPFKLYLQEDFFNQKVQKIKSTEIIILSKPKTIDHDDPVYDPGVTLSEYNEMLKYGHNFKTAKIHADNNHEQQVNRFRINLKQTLSENKKFMIVNYYGKKIGSKTGGHLSPIAAYDEESDSVLILDVALHKGTWFWVKVTNLYNAMHTKDGEKYRGYLIVGKK